jgi:hypothetical protein
MLFVDIIWGVPSRDEGIEKQRMVQRPIRFFSDVDGQIFREKFKGQPGIHSVHKVYCQRTQSVIFALRSTRSGVEGCVFIAKKPKEALKVIDNLAQIG